MNYLLTFLEGFASFISPCILPLVPMYISYFSGVQKSDTKKTLVNSILFVLGFTIIFILMAVFASTIGIFINDNIKAIKIIFGFLMILLGLIYMDLIKLNGINFLSLKKSFDVSNLNPIRSFLFGIFFSVSHIPCVGVFLGSALMLISSEQDILKGVILMLLYSLGIGIPFIISAILVEKLKTTFDFIKRNFKIVKIISGIMLILTGLYFIIFSLKGTTQEVLTQTENAPEEEIISNDINQDNIYDEAVYTALLELSEDEFEEKVLKADKKVLVDFYADWCIPCHMFSPVIEEVAKENDDVYFYRINVDENNNLANRYRIIYLPTLICFESGEELNRFIGAGNKEDVLELIK